jgi:hypothetical protein
MSDPGLALISYRPTWVATSWGDAALPDREHASLTPPLASHYTRAERSCLAAGQ